jgi:hypothetical protein
VANEHHQHKVGADTLKVFETSAGPVHLRGHGGRPMTKGYDDKLDLKPVEARTGL